MNKRIIKAELEMILRAHPRQVTMYKAGKISLFDFFLGELMKKTGGQANPVIVGELLKKMLEGMNK